MSMERAGGRGSGVAMLVAAGIVYEIIAAACSSPQTTEINADKRADTLMKWVYIGEVQAAIFVLTAAYCDPQYAKEYVIGGVAAGALMHGSYLYARKCGLQTLYLPGTES
jgi:hypothetical protein